MSITTKKQLFSIPLSISEELDNISKEISKNKSNIVSEALEMYFDMVDLKVAKERSENIKNNKDKTVSFDEMFDSLDV